MEDKTKPNAMYRNARSGEIVSASIFFRDGRVVYKETKAGESLINTPKVHHDPTQTRELSDLEKIAVATSK